MARDRANRRVVSGRVNRRSRDAVPARDYALPNSQSNSRRNPDTSRPGNHLTSRLPRHSALSPDYPTPGDNSAAPSESQASHNVSYYDPELGAAAVGPQPIQTGHTDSHSFYPVRLASSENHSTQLASSRGSNAMDNTNAVSPGSCISIHDEQCTTNQQRAVAADVIDLTRQSCNHQVHVDMNANIDRQGMYNNYAQNEDVFYSDLRQHHGTQPHDTQAEINGHTNSQINLTHSVNYNSFPLANAGDHYPPLSVPDAVSGYTITELPRLTESSLHYPSAMMARSEQSQPPAPDRSMLHDQSYHSDRHAMECLPTPEPFYIPPVRTTRRERRHRDRRRRRRRSRHHHRHRSQRHHPQVIDDDQYIKPCCSSLACKICLSLCLQFKKVLVFFASFGIICVLLGIILGVLKKTPGNSFFTLSLMFVGLGLILLAMVLVGWKCTPADHEPCHMLFGLGAYSTISRRGRRRRERLYWLGGTLYPEFRHRRPPPSYAAAMQDQRNEIRQIEPVPYVPRSPPPSYKSHTTIERPGIHIIFPRDGAFPESNPPTYRLRNQAERPTILNNSSFIASTDDQCVTIPNRFSVSSTAGLVESEQFHEGTTPTEPHTGFVNHSFSTSEANLELSAHRLERDYVLQPEPSQVPVVIVDRPSQSTSHSASSQSTGHSASIHTPPESIILEMVNNDQNSSTL